MWLRPPVRIWRMISRELWRLAALSVVALCGIVSFAATMRPLAEGQLGAADAIKYMALAIVPMLQFTTPFAAGFAATLAYHRFASENEHLAASAGGVSHRSILTPALGLGIVLALCVAALAHMVIPNFLRSMKELVTRDVARLMVSSIERGDAVNLEGLEIHADRVIRGAPDPARGVMERLFLHGVVAIDTTRDGAVQAEVVARRAEVLLSSERQDGEAVTVVRMRLDGAVGRQAGEALADVGVVRVPPWLVPDAFEESPRYYTFTQLGELRLQPERHNAVDLLRRRLAAELTRRRGERLLVAAVAGESRIVFRDGLDQRIAVRADGIHAEGDRWRLAPISEHGVEIDWRLADGGRRSQAAQRAHVIVRADESASPAMFTLELEGVSSRDTGRMVRDRLSLSQLTLDGDDGARLFELSPRRLLAEAERVIEQAADDPEIAAVVEQRDALIARMERLDREITGRHHERFALAVACLLMTLTGAIMALRLRDGMPLQVYLWSFFPALGAVITISGGENVAAQNMTAGLAVLWGGVGALGAYTLYEYVRLARR